MSPRVLVPLLLLVAACKKAPPPPPPPEPEPEPVVEPEPEPEPEPVPEEKVEEVIRNLERVHFQFDSTALVGESDAALRSNAAIMQEFPNLRIEVQGHADERGTTEYNLALGQKRGQAIKDRLTGMGVSPSQVSVVSYGEERPLAYGGGESVWSKNRRAEFRVLSGDLPVKGTIDG